MVAFNQGDLDAKTAAATDNNKAFYFVAHFDDEGIIRISDNAYEVKRLLSVIFLKSPVVEILGIKSTTVAILNSS